VEVRPPAGSDARIPHVSVGRLVLPVAVLIESGSVRLNGFRKIFRRHTEAGVAQVLGPAVEGIPRSRVEDIRRRRTQAGARERSLARTERRLTIFIDEIGLASQDCELDFNVARVTRRRKNRDAICAGADDLHPRRRRIDAIVDVSCAGLARGGNIQSHATLEESNHFVGLKVDARVHVEVQRAAVAEQDFCASVLGPDAIAGKKRHRCRSRFGAAIPFEDNCAIDDRDVRGRVVRDTLSTGGRRSRETPHKRGNDESQAGHKDLCARIQSVENPRGPGFSMGEGWQASV
jgi:hypothetical protein